MRVIFANGTLLGGLLVVFQPFVLDILLIHFELLRACKFMVQRAIYYKKLDISTVMLNAGTSDAEGGIIKYIRGPILRGHGPADPL
jgi:hypothetical protein